MKRLFLFLLMIVTLAAPSIAAPVRKPRVVVVGGGLAGLITAYELEKRGLDTIVLEASPLLGGRVATAHYAGGLRAEYGMQEIWQQNPLIALIKELGLETESSDDPWSSMIIGDRLYPFVQDTRQLYFETLFDAAQRAEFAKAIAELERLYRAAHGGRLTEELTALQDMSFADWLDKQGYSQRVKDALRLTIEVELAAVSEQFSALSAIMEYRTFLFKGESNYHVKGGNIRIIDALARRIGGPKLVGARVTEVSRYPRKDGTFDCVVRYMKDEKLQSVRGDAVVVAIPWTYLHMIQFHPALPRAQRKAIDSLGRGQYTVVHMRIDKQAEALWKVDGEDPFPILSNGPLGVVYGPHANEGRGTDIIFGLLIYGPEAQAYHMVPRDEKRVELLQGLDKLWPGFSRHVKDVQFFGYHPAAVAYWPPGRSPMDEGSRALRLGNHGLFLAGDWLYSSHSEGAVMSAHQTARSVQAFLQLRDQVRTVPRVTK